MKIKRKYKTCTLCKKSLLIKNFRKSGYKNSLASRCTPCAVIAYRERHLQNKYGISLDEYDRLLEKQNYTCDICNKPQVVSKRMCVDHDHDTGKVRGLLCHHCNTGLGKFQDDKKLLEAAIQYLIEHDK